MKLMELMMEDPGLYIAVNFSEKTSNNLVAFCKNHNIPNPVNREKLHTTIIYSTKYAEVIPEVYSEKIDPKTYKWEKFKGTGSSEDNCLVLTFKSDKLSERFNIALDAGAVTNFPEYKSHVTLSYNAAKFDISNLPLPPFPLEIEEEFQKALNKDWAA